MRVAFIILGFVFSMSSAPAYPTQQSPSSSGEDLLKAGKAVEAREVFESELTADPGNAAAQGGEVASSERVALDARQHGQMDDALKALLRAQTFAPKNERLLYDLGILEDEMHLYRDADTTLSSLEQLHPADPHVLYAIARVKMDLGQMSAAEEKLEAYLKAEPNDASAHYGLGRVYQLNLQVDKARAEFQRSIELKPVQTESYYELGDIALGQGNFDEAIDYFSKTLARDPRHAGALAGTGEAYFKEKQYAKAEEFLERAVAVAPNYHPGHYYLGLTLARLGRKEESQRELDLATKLADEANKRDRSGLHLITPPTSP